MTSGAWTLAYICTIIFSNLLLIWLPPIELFGSMLPPAIFAAGFVFVLRDYAQREIGQNIWMAIATASGATYILAGPEVAAASTIAFTVAEIVDWAVYSLTKAPFSRRILISSLVSVPVDTAVFFAALGILDAKSLLLGIGVKLIGTAIFWSYWFHRESKQARVDGLTNATHPSEPAPAEIGAAL